MYNIDVKGDVMFKKLAQQLKAQNLENKYSSVSSPIQNSENPFLKNLSKHALNLYEQKTDVKNFSKLALSDPENSSHNQIMDKLFRYGDVIDPFEESKLFDLSDNEHFLRDLGLK